MSLLPSVQAPRSLVTVHLFPFLLGSLTWVFIIPDLILHYSLGFLWILMSTFLIPTSWVFPDSMVCDGLALICLNLSPSFA